MKQLYQVQERISEIKKLAAEVIAISTMGDQKDVEKTKRELEITFTLIPKPNRKVAEDFGVWSKSHNVALATIIIDKKGRIRFKEIGKPFWINLPAAGSRTSVSEIIRQLQGI